MTEDKEHQSFISNYKPQIVTGLLAFTFSSIIYRIRKNTRGTTDFGMEKLMKDPVLRGNVQHASWIWAIRAFSYSTAIVGLGATGMCVGVSYAMNVSTLKEFSIEFRNLIKKKFPLLAVPQSKAEDEDDALTKFYEDLKLDLEREPPALSDHENMVSDTLRQGLGPLGHYVKR